MAVYSERHHTATYTGSNSADVLNFCLGCDSWSYSIISETGGVLTIGAYEGEDITRSIVMNVGDKVAKSRDYNGFWRLTGPWDTTAFAEAFTEVPES